ncbi:ABC transporter substrate-binding protein [Rhodopila sp.]|jgi:peptide/nickel transport system substrate-binding protein|uniref:ABC transporter substrate-binding protein n=1 Tax=Rhodopila sp. TaxID=2480087 RepID=UPI002B85A9CC|nr:ABC transporter substrate-binding protein [Rhodopila sp.]HVZ07614.1 ABC transporter substrate-binding protein [Rhodopila sp.]
MKRRTLLATAAAATLARPAIAAPDRTLIFIPQANLTSLDPVWTTATVTRNFACMVYEMLYARDQAFVPRPMMVQGHVVEDDGKRWTMTLREGLTWHDGTPVLARDCVASLRRWMKRDAVGATIGARLEELGAPTDRSIVWRFNRPLPLLPHLLSKVQPQPVMMPERLAATDPFKQVSEIVGCGPFRFEPSDYVSGSRAAFSRFERYVPRQEAPSYLAGGHVVKVDRVEWRIIPDAATAANALIAGEVDWLELPQPDLIPMLKTRPGVSTGLLDIFGTVGILRPNHLLAPTSNVGVRRAMFAAIDQREVMVAAMGEDPASWHVPMGYFLPGSPAANDAGMDFVRKRHSVDDVKRMLDAAKYGGEKIVFLHPTDQLVYNAISTVVVDRFRKAGLTIDEQMTDWGTVVQRRPSKEGLDKGGWSMFPAGAPGPEFVDPLLANTLRSNGSKAWFGWPDDPALEAAYSAWLDAPDDHERHRQEIAFQTAAFTSVPSIPLGQYLPHAAWRSNVTGLLKGSAPVFWNVEKS